MVGLGIRKHLEVSCNDRNLSAVRLFASVVCVRHALCGLGRVRGQARGGETGRGCITVVRGDGQAGVHGSRLAGTLHRAGTGRDRRYRCQDPQSDRFFRTLQSAKAGLEQKRVWWDHREFTGREWERLERAIARSERQWAEADSELRQSIPMPTTIRIGGRTLSVGDGRVRPKEG